MFGLNWLYIDNAKMHLKHKMIAELWSLISDGALGTGKLQLFGRHLGTSTWAHWHTRSKD